MQKRLRTILTVVLSIILVLSAGMLVHQQFSRRNAVRAADQAMALAGISTAPQDKPTLPEEPTIPEQPTNETPTIIEDETPPLSELPKELIPSLDRPGVWQDAPVTDDPYMDLLAETDLAALREINEDVLGWIIIPDTYVNHPLMDGDDNSFYLDHAWDRTPSFYGSVFLEQQSSSDLTDFNTILYGHNMGDENIFGSLKHYNDEAYWKEHPYVYIVDDRGVHRYEIFAAYEASIRSIVYVLDFDDDLRERFIEAAVEHSVIDTGITPVITNRILTLSTCTGYTKNTRWVVQARLVSARDAE
ncbi:MAG: sortase [Ruminococcaceae bacterium]|nr:sortase [Oscillospiraceae bacterium]